jgi:hypothetical protein
MNKYKIGILSQARNELGVSSFLPRREPQLSRLSKRMKTSYYRESNTEIQEFAEKHNITDYRELESLFIQKLFAVLNALPTNKTYVGTYESPYFSCLSHGQQWEGFSVPVQAKTKKSQKSPLC